MSFDQFVLVALCMASCLALAVVVVSGGEQDPEPDKATDANEGKRKVRKRRRREERGLPEFADLRALAATYLEVQNRLWPQLRGTRDLPPVTDEAIDLLAKRFVQIFLGEVVVPFLPSLPTSLWKALAAAYVRYSDDNSNPRSLDQQLRLALERAAQLGHFIPWNYVFADAAVTATTAARRGYQLAKKAISQKDLCIETFYIDELGRAARDVVEALSLGYDVKNLNKRLLGVSDGFDSESPMWKLHLLIYGLLHEYFIDQLRPKVIRGMLDAFRQGTNVGLPALGYKLVPAIDAQGRQIRGKDGADAKMLAIHEADAAHVVSAFVLFAEERWSLTRIAKFFNEKKVGGRNSWVASTIRLLLERRKYIGIDVYGTVRHTKDRVTGKITTHRVPRKEWKIRRARHLQIVPKKLWKQARCRLKELDAAFSSNRKPTVARSEVYPTTLVRPKCGCCGSELWLGRSGKYASYTCTAGRDRRNDCTFRGYKTVSIVESAILNFLLRMLDEGHIDQLVARANEFLQSEAAKPKEDAEPLRKELREVQARADRLAEMIDNESGDPSPRLLKKLKAREKRCRVLSRQIRAIDASFHVPAQLDRQMVLQHLASLRTLLQQDVAKAAPAIRALTGDITVIQRAEEGKRKPVWFAQFSVDSLPILLKLAREADCPTTAALEYLTEHSWTNTQQVEVRLENVEPCDQFGQQFAEMFNNGASVNEISAAFGMSWNLANEIVQFGLTGVRPNWQSSKKKSVPSKETPKFLLIQEDVVFLRDEKERPVPEIVEWLAKEKGIVVSAATVRRSYDMAKQGRTRAALEAGEKPQKAPWRFLPEDKVKMLRALISEGNLFDREIAEVVGVGRNTVPRERRAMLLAKAS